MSPRKKKTRKLREHVSHGHDRICKHRKQPGGCDNAGGMHHHRINIDKYHPGYFGKPGMCNYHLGRNSKGSPAMNLDKLWTLFSEQTKLQYKDHLEVKAPVIDIVKAGYHKLLGEGRLSDQPIIVKTKFFSKSAKDKIKAVEQASVLSA
nr:60S ribosomal protein L27a-like [Leptinotarsa decemlineata]